MEACLRQRLPLEALQVHLARLWSKDNSSLDDGLPNDESATIAVQARHIAIASYSDEQVHACSGILDSNEFVLATLLLLIH